MFPVHPPLSALGGARRALPLAGLLLLAACGQKGPLFLPSGEAAAGRATLPQLLNPAAPAPAASAASAAASAASSPSAPPAAARAATPASQP